MGKSEPCSHGIIRGAPHCCTRLPSLHYIHLLGGGRGRGFLPAPPARTSRPSVCRKVSQGRQVAIWPRSPPCRAQELAPAREANARSHPHLPGEPLQLWGEGKRSGPQQRHDNKPASGVRPRPPHFCSLASGGFSWYQTALGNSFQTHQGSALGTCVRGVCTGPHIHVLQWRSASCKQKFLH